MSTSRITVSFSAGSVGGQSHHCHAGRIIGIRVAMLSLRSLIGPGRASGLSSHIAS